mgnify:CR=1 FL=1
MPVNTLLPRQKLQSTTSIAVTCCQSPQCKICFFFTLTGDLNLMCCFSKFSLTKSHKYSKVSRVTLKCSFQRKLSARLVNKWQNQFFGLSQSQALLCLHWSICWLIWLKNINIARHWFLRCISAPSCDHFGRHGECKKFLPTKISTKVTNWDRQIIKEASLEN